MLVFFVIVEVGESCVGVFLCVHDYNTGSLVGLSYCQFVVVFESVEGVSFVSCEVVCRCYFVHGVYVGVGYQELKFYV